MTKSSRVTVRDQPVEQTVAVEGVMRVHSETVVVDTNTRIEFVDITDRVAAVLAGAHIAEGMLSLFSMHTTCSVLVNEVQPALQADIRHFLEQTVDRDADWRHNDPDQSDCDRGNADAHLRALMLGPSLTLQVSGGELVLGQWQRVLVAELDGPRARSIRVSVLGTKAS